MFWIFWVGQARWGTILQVVGYGIMGLFFAMMCATYLGYKRWTLLHCHFLAFGWYRGSHMSIYFVGGCIWKGGGVVLVEFLW